MQEFLNGKSILRSAKDLIAEGEDIRLAVSYWGQGAIDKLEIIGSKKVQILCDLMHPGCNPYEIEKLLQPSFVGAVEVKHLARLHSKVYASDRAVIVGSANASSNGLGSDDVTENEEAAIFTQHEPTLRDVTSWFDQKWNSDAATIVDEKLVEASKRVPRPPRRSFLEELLHNPSWFGKRVVLVYIDEDASPAAESAFFKVAKNHYTEQERKEWRRGDEPFYQAGMSKNKMQKFISPGDFIINCAHSPTPVNSVKEPGCIKISTNDCLVLVNSDDPKTVMNVPFPNRERKLLHRAAKKYLEQFNTSPNTYLKAKYGFGQTVGEMKSELKELIRQELSASQC